MDRVVFIKKILLFCTNSPDRLLHLSHVNSSFRDTVINEPYSVASHVMFNCLHTEQETTTATTNTSKIDVFNCDRFFQKCCLFGICWAVQSYLDAVRAIADEKQNNNKQPDGYYYHDHHDQYNHHSSKSSTINAEIDLGWFQCALGGSVDVLRILDTWHRQYQGEEEVERVQHCHSSGLLYQASIRGNVDFVAYILSHWEHIDIDQSAEKCLLAAVSKGQMQMIDFLLSGGRRKVNEQSNSNPPWIEIKRSFMTIEPQSQLQWTVIHEAIANSQSTEIIDRLFTVQDLDIDSQATLEEFRQEIQENFASTLYCFAAVNNNVDAMRVLSKHGISPSFDQDENQGNSDLQQSYESRRRNNHITNGYRKLNLSPLDEALLSDSVNTFQFLLSHQYDEDQIAERQDDLTIGKPGNLLLFAAVVGSQKVLESLLRDYPNVTKELIDKDYQGWTALSLVCQQMTLPVVQAINASRSHWTVPKYSDLNLEYYSKEKRLKIIDLLIEQGGADMNIRPCELQEQNQQQQQQDNEQHYFHDQHQDYYYHQTLKTNAAPFPLSGRDHTTPSMTDSSKLTSSSKAHLLDSVAAKYRASHSFFSFRALGGMMTTVTSSSLTEEEQQDNCNNDERVQENNTTRHYQRAKEKALSSFFYRVLTKLLEKEGAGSPRIRNRARRDAGFNYSETAEKVFAKVENDTSTNTDNDDRNSAAISMIETEEDLYEQEICKKACVLCSQEFSHFSRSHVCCMCNAVCCSSCGGFSAKHDVGFYQDSVKIEKDDSYCKSCLVWMRE